MQEMLADGNFMQKNEGTCISALPQRMCIMIVKKVPICSSVTELGLLTKKKDERNVWVVISRTPTSNCDSDKVKGYNKCRHPCTACLDSLDCDTMKESDKTPTTAFKDAILDLVQHDS